MLCYVMLTETNRFVYYDHNYSSIATCISSNSRQ